MTQPTRELHITLRRPRLARGRKQALTNLLGAGLAVGAAYVAWMIETGLASGGETLDGVLANLLADLNQPNPLM